MGSNEGTAGIRVSIFRSEGYCVSQNKQNVQHVFVVGSKGIPGNYGSYETFVDKLTEYHQDNPRLRYHVACRSDEVGSFLLSQRALLQNYEN